MMMSLPPPPMIFWLALPPMMMSFPDVPWTTLALLWITLACRRDALAPPCGTLLGAPPLGKFPLASRFCDVGLRAGACVAGAAARAVDGAAAPLETSLLSVVVRTVGRCVLRETVVMHHL